jgi:predicted porin
MNKRKPTLILVTCTAMLAPQAFAQSSVTIYGVADVGVDVGRAGGGSLTRVISGGSFASRLGFRGSEDLGGGLSALFKLEQGFSLDDGVLAQGGRVFGREASIGLSSTTLGTVTAGRLPTPVSLLQINVDAFNWMGSGGAISLTRSGTAVVTQVLPQVVSARIDNAIGYVSPNWSGLELRAMVAAGEGSTTIGKAYGGSARYSSGPINAVAAVGVQDGAGDTGGRITSFTLGGSYSFGVPQLFVGYTDEKNSCSTCTGSLARAPGVTGTRASRFSLTNVGVRVPIGGFVLIAQVARVDDRSEYTVNPGSRDATWIAVGAEYYLSKRTAFYSALGTIDNQNGSQYALGTSGVQQRAGFVSSGDPRSTTMSLGMRHLF